MKVFSFGLILFLCCAIEPASGQDNGVILSGRIIDVSTQLPVPFVNIQVKSRSIGTASNEEGEFVFRIPEVYLQDTLRVSCIGYMPHDFPVSALNSNMTIGLDQATVQLAGITVTAQSGLELLKRVLSKIPENYDTSAVQLTAFYREQVVLDDFELAFTEAVLDVNKVFTVDKVHNDVIRIIKGRKKKIDFGSDGQFYYWMSGISNGARGSLTDDLVKYRDLDFSPFNPPNFRFYNYDIVESIYDGQQNLIVLEVSPKNKSKKGIFHLRVFIEEESLAIVKYDYELTEAGVARTSRKDKGLAYAIMTRVVQATRDYHKFQGTVAFKRYKDKWYLNGITRHWEILVNSKKRNMVDAEWKADMHLVVTDISTEHVRPIFQNDIGNNEGSMGSLVGDDYDIGFWETYNIMKPSLADSLRYVDPPTDTLKKKSNTPPLVSNRQNGFTRADTLRGKLTPLRTCFDVTFYHLDVAIDMEQRSVAGSNLIRFNVVEPFKTMQIDLYANMKINSIDYKGEQLKYWREFDAVFVQFPSALKKGNEEEIKVFYAGVPKTPDFSIPMNGGVLWDKDSLGNPWAQMVCQGSGASLWWPNKDHLSDEPDSMKIWITVPSAYTEISNGRLLKKTSLPNKQTRYEWLVSYPINNYNVTFNVGMYSQIRDSFVNEDTLTLDYYVMPYNLERSKKIFSQVKPMLACFEKNFGKYPFSRDGFTLVESPYPMEHQSGVCIGKINYQNATDTNPLIWHESAHEWWGNATSCTDMADLWIHEAFATYSEAMVVECTYGKEAAIEFINNEQGRVLGAQPIIGVGDVNHIYYDIADMYSKGSLMLNTFRSVLDDDVAWADLLQRIQQNFRYQTLTSDQLIDFINKETKTDYTYFLNNISNTLRCQRLSLRSKRLTKI